MITRLDAGAPPPSSTIATRRLTLLLVALLLVVAAVGARTIWLQSVKNRTLSRYAEGQQQNTQVLPAVRGDILDRNGQELAVGEEAVTFHATPALVKDPVGTALQVSRLLNFTRSEQEALVQRLSEAEGGFEYVARQVPREQATALQDAELPGIGWYDEERRMYPLGVVAGQLLGTVDIDNKGIEGLEALYDRSLTGQPGRQVAVKDPSGVPIDVLQLQRERDGHDVQLTIDAIIQQEAERVLRDTLKQHGARAGTAIVMNPRTGEILAMAGAPPVNPSRWGSFSGESRRMRAVTDTFEPGSTFKVVAISGALEEGVVTPGSSFLLPPKLTFCDDKETCTVGESHPRPTQWMTTKQILVESSNVGTITIAQRLGRERFDAWVKRFGFGSLTGIDFPGETPGLMTPLEEWSDVSIGNIPIGQGISVTPIQLVSAYAAIANDGVLVQPHLLKRIGTEKSAPPQRRRVISARTARVMRSMFGGVVKDERGTGKRAQITDYEVGGKTGTANVAEQGIYVKGKYIASFVGFVPADNPQLVTLVVVNEPQGSGYGGDVAAPAFEQITEFALRYLAIPPDGVL